MSFITEDTQPVTAELGQQNVEWSDNLWQTSWNAKDLGHSNIQWTSDQQVGWRSVLSVDS